MTIKPCPQPPGGWTFETLREHLYGIMDERDRRYDQRFDISQKAIETALAGVKESSAVVQQAADRAVAKAESASEKRFDSVNEFRATLADQQRTLMPRSEAEIRFSSMESKVSDLFGSIEKISNTRQGITSGWGYAVIVVSLLFGAVGTVVALIFHGAR